VPGGTTPFTAPEPPTAPTTARQVSGDLRQLPEPQDEPYEPQDEPQPLLKGSFAIYITPVHSIVLAYRPEGIEETKQMVVPPFVIGMAARQSGQSPEELISQLRKGF
jgi:hypothetical protein